MGADSPIDRGRPRESVRQEDVRRGVMLTLVSDVAAGYFRLLELDRELAIAQESSKTYKADARSVYAALSVRQGQQTPVERAQAAYDSSIASIAALRRAIVQQENALSILLGVYPKEIERGTRVNPTVHAQHSGRLDE